MKIDRFFSRFFLVAAVCVFCACSSDDDEDDGSGSGGSGKGSVTLNIGGVKATLDNVYWIAEPSGDGTNYYELQFMSFDMYKYVPGGDHSSFPSNYSVVYISFEAPGTLSEIPVGTFTEDSYEVSGIWGAPAVNDDGRYYIEESPASGNLVITKTGDNYTVTIDPLEIVYSDPASLGEGDWTATTVKWNYTGKIKKAPAEQNGVSKPVGNMPASSLPAYLQR